MIWGRGVALALLAFAAFVAFNVGYDAAYLWIVRGCR